MKGNEKMIYLKSCTCCYVKKQWENATEMKPIPKIGIKFSQTMSEMWLWSLMTTHKFMNIHEQRMQQLDWSTSEHHKQVKIFENGQKACAWIVIPY